MAQLFQSFLGGQHGEVDPSLLDVIQNGGSQYALGWNVDIRGGLLTTRPGWERVYLTFPSDLARTIFNSGKYQGCCTYVTGGQDYVACAVRGNVFLINPANGEVDHLSARGGALNEYVERCYFQQAGPHLIVQDGYSIPLLVTGRLVRRATGENMIPTGTFMAYGQNRLFLCRGPNAILACDIFQTRDPDNVLKATEWYDIGAGGDHLGIGQELGPITALAFQSQVDTSLGQGNLLVSGLHGIRSYDVSLPRSQWYQTSAFSKIVTAGEFEGMATSAPVRINSDLLYTAHDGNIRSLGQQFTQERGWQDVAISAELRPWIANETLWATRYAFAASCGQRAFFSGMARQCQVFDSSEKSKVYDTFFRCLYVLDLQPVATIHGAQPPVWCGAWTGLNFLGAVAARSSHSIHLYAFSKDSGAYNVFYRLNPLALDDEGNQKIHCQVNLGLRELGNRAKDKQLGDARWWLSDMAGTDLYWSIKARARGAQSWLTWAERTYQSPTASAVDALAHQARRHERIGAPAMTCGKGDPRSANVGDLFELVLDWKGHLQVDRIWLDATEVSAGTAGACGPDRSVEQPITHLETPLAYSTSRGETPE